MDYFRQNTYVYYGTNIKSGRNFLIWAYPGMKFFFLISTFFTDSENIYIDYKLNGPFSIEHPICLFHTPSHSIDMYIIRKFLKSRSTLPLGSTN